MASIAKSCLAAFASAVLLFVAADAATNTELFSTLVSPSTSYYTASTNVFQMFQVPSSFATGYLFDDIKVSYEQVGTTSIVLDLIIRELSSGQTVFSCRSDSLPVSPLGVYGCSTTGANAVLTNRGAVNPSSTYAIGIRRFDGSMDAQFGTTETTVTGIIGYTLTSAFGVTLSDATGGIQSQSGGNTNGRLKVGVYVIPVPSVSPSRSATPSQSATVSPSTSVSASGSPSTSVSASCSSSTSVSPSFTPSATITRSMTTTRTVTPLPCSAKARYISIESPAQFPVMIDELVVLDDEGKNVARRAQVTASSVLGNDDARYGVKHVTDGIINNPVDVKRRTGAWRPATALGDDAVLTLTFPAPGVRLRELRMMTRGGLTASQLRAVDYEVRINGDKCSTGQGRGRFTMVNASAPFTYTPRFVIPSVYTISIRRTTDINIGSIEAWGYDPARPLERFNAYNLIDVARRAGTLKASASSFFLPSNLDTSAYRPSNAVDQSLGTSWMSTADDSNPTLTIDLGKEYMVSIVKVWPRHDCCYQRNIGAGVRLLDAQQKIQGTASSLLFLAHNFVATGQFTSCAVAADEKEVYGYWTVKAKGC